MPSCSKNFTLTVADVDEPALDWGALMWGSPYINEVGSGTGSFTPSSSASASFECDCSAENLNWSDHTEVNNAADVAYNGDAINCNAHVVIDIEGAGVTKVIGSITISGFFAPIDETFNIPRGSGSFDIPFTIPSTLGVPKVVHVYVSAQAGANFGDPLMHINMKATFSNV